VDTRVALVNSGYVTKDHPLHYFVVQFVNLLELTTDNSGEHTLLLPSLPNMEVFRIQHKRRTSYLYEEIFNIDVVNVRVFDREDKVIENKFIPSSEIKFESTPAEVEVSNLKWQRAFKYNKPNRFMHTAWAAEEIVAGFPKYLQVVRDVAALLQSSGEKVE